MARSPLDKIRSLSTRIESIDTDVRQLNEELSMLQHIDDDAQRDALVSGHWDDRTDAKRTASDVARINKQLYEMDRTRGKLATKRAELIRNLAGGDR